MGQNDYTKCSGSKQLIICCPTEEKKAERLYEKKCREYQKHVNEISFSSNLLPNSKLNKIPVDKCGLNTIKLISGGENAKLKQFPHMAALGYLIGDRLKFDQCGGSLISERYVLTAAHCMKSDDPYLVRIGDINIGSNNEAPSRVDIRVKDIILHPNWNPEKKKNDIALIKLVENVKFDEYKRPACLPSFSEWPGDNSIATGWGYTSYHHIAGSDILQQVKLEKYTEEECAGYKPNRFAQISYSTQICVGSKNSDGDTCSGDSGSPLQVFNMKNIYCMWDIVAVTSYGPIRCGNMKPGIYTRVFPFVDWIENEVWTSLCKTKNNSSGICRYLKDCPQVREKNNDYKVCTLDPLIICCPESSATSSDSEISTLGRRKHEIKCSEYTDAVYEESGQSLLRNSVPKKVDKCGNKNVPLIIGGEKAGPREFPHMALIGYMVNDEKQWKCGGTLVSDEYVLTAAHCLISQKFGPALFVRLGELDISRTDDESEPEDFDIIKRIPHPSYNTNFKYNDIGLIQLNRKVDLNPFKRPACLPSLFDGSELRVIVTGWGVTSYLGTPSNELQKVVLEKFNNSQCTKTYSSVSRGELKDGIKTETQLCAGSSNERKDACSGDSGGPVQVFHPTEYCMYTIVGITSFGIQCAQPKVPGVFTRVYPYIDWIESIVWQ